MTVDLVLAGGTVVDGTGAPARVADVAVRDGRVVAIGEVGESATRTIDADGLVVAPGFIDLHTHYDAQLMWDPTAHPSPLHGVTTIFGGNCGFAVAPAAPENVDYLARLMSRVEGIPLAALQQGLTWDWTSWGEWNDRFTGAIVPNAGFLGGHSTLRRAVMGERAIGEEATEEELVAMERLLDECLRAGALGFSTSMSPTHNDGDGNPVPSRFATRDEILRLAARVREFPGTQLEMVLAGTIAGFTDDEVALVAEMSRVADRPLNWNVLGVVAGGNHQSQLEASTRASELGGRVIALTLPMTMAIRLSFATGFVLDGLPRWRELLYSRPRAERAAALADPQIRAQLDEGARSPEAGLLRNLANWERFTLVECFAPENKRFEGRTVGDVAAELGTSAFDALCDIAVADDLRTGIRPELPPEDEGTWAERVKVWRDPRAVVGASDAGAHLDMFCSAGYATFMVGEAVRDRALVTMEEAVRLLTDVPAQLYGLRDRGRIAENGIADLVVFDPATVGPGPEHTRDDLPGGESRITVEAEGVEHVFVNGVEVVRGGAFTGATPGTALRAGRDTATVHAN